MIVIFGVALSQNRQDMRQNRFDIWTEHGRHFFYLISYSFALGLFQILDSYRDYELDFLKLLKQASQDKPIDEFH